MRLCEALGLPDSGVLSLVGGGGKSSLLLRLTKEWSVDRRVVAVTTTHITRAQGEALGLLLLGGSPDALHAALREHSAVCAALSAEGDKLSPPPPALLRAAPTLADWVLAEADGAHGFPVKAPACHEPVLLPGGYVVGVAGLSALGRPLSEVCHRPSLAAALLGVPPGAALTPSLLAGLLTSEHGQRKGVEDPARFRVLLNQADMVPRHLACAAAAEIERLLPGCRVVIASLREEDCIKEVFDGCS